MGQLGRIAAADEIATTANCNNRQVW